MSTHAGTGLEAAMKQKKKKSCMQRLVEGSSCKGAFCVRQPIKCEMNESKMV